MGLSRFHADNFFELERYKHRDLFAGTSFVWQALVRLSEHINDKLQAISIDKGSLGKPLAETIAIWRGRLWRDGFVICGGDVTKGQFKVRFGQETTTDAIILYAGSVLWDDQIQLGPGSVVEPGALIKGPTIVGSHTEVRQGAYIRGKCVIGDCCVVGHTTEMKASIMLNGAKAGHFAYIGDSILGNDCNLGAGTKLANLKITHRPVRVPIGNEFYDTGLRKFGAVIGDRSELGCNAVTNPGTLLGRDCLVLPSTSVSAGCYPDRSRIS